MSTYLRQTKALALAVFLALAVALGLAFATPSAAQADEGDLQAGGIQTQATQLEDGVYKLPDLAVMAKGSASRMYNKLESDKFLRVQGDTATLIFTTNGSSASIGYNTRVALGQGSVLFPDADPKSYNQNLPEGTKVFYGVYAGKDAGDKWCFEIALSKDEMQSYLGANSENKLYFCFWNANKSGWYKAGDDLYMSLGALGDKVAADSTSTTLAVTNDERMFVVNKAILEDNAQGFDYLTFYLNGSSYDWAFSGNQDDAVKTFNDKEASSLWCAKGDQATFDPVEVTLYDDTKKTRTTGYPYRVPVVVTDAASCSFDVVAFSGTSKLGEPGQNFSARKFTVNKNDGTMRASSASDTATVTVTSSLTSIPSGEGAVKYAGFTRPYAGGDQTAETTPLSNDWVGDLTVSLGDSSVYDKAYVVNYAGAPWLKATAATIEPSAGDYATVANDGALTLHVVNEYDTTPKTTQLNGNIIKVMMHVKANATTPAADTWVERTFQLDFNSRTKATLKISGNPLTYNVTFVDEDGKTVLKAATPYAVGTKADKIVQPATPKKAPDSAYSYEFAGWTPALADVTADATYKATYTKKAHPKVTFVDEDGTTVLKAATPYPVGTKAADIVQPATPTKAADRDYTYEFSGWTPALADVTADATYKATYKATKKGSQFNVTFVDENGTVLKAATPYATGTKAADIAQPAAPTKASDGTYTYEFAGWTPALADVTADATYTATYKATIIHHEEPARLEGNIALDTMKAIVDEGWKGQTETVVLTTVDGYWDALTAAGVAGMAKAPVLMSNGATLSDQTKATITELAPSKIVVCGGTAAVSDDVAQAAIDAAGGSAKLIRCWGQTATGTAVDCFNKAKSEGLGEWSAQAFVCTNDGYWDALAAAPISYAKAMPIFLTEGSSDISDETLTAMKDGGIKAVYIVGGEMAINPTVAAKIEAAGIEVAGRLAGEIAVATSEAVADFGLAHDMTCAKMGVATTNGYWDALAGAPLCGLNNSVLVLAGDSSSSSIAGFVTKHAAEIGTCYVFGGKAAIDEATFAAIKAAIA